jgi:hypothetical protein
MIRGLKIASTLVVINLCLMFVLSFIGWDTYESISPQMWGAAGRFYFLTTNAVCLVVLFRVFGRGQYVHNNDKA